MISSCKPDEAIGALDNFQLTLNTDIFNYRKTIQFQDQMGQPLQDVDIEIEGRDAERIYTELGRKDFFVNNGFITLAVHPGMEPVSATDTIKFTVYASAPNKEAGSFDVNILFEEFQYLFQFSFCHQLRQLSQHRLRYLETLLNSISLAKY